MKQKLSCEIIRDLLPSYAEGLTSAASNDAVRTHLESCPKCRQALADMREPGHEETAVEIDYLKTVRRRTKKKIILAVLGAVASVALFLCVWIFAIGSPAPAYLLDYQIDVDGTSVSLGGVSRETYKRYTFTTIREQDGILDVTVRFAPSRLDGGDLFVKTYQAKEPIQAIRINGQVVWEDQITVSELASLLFDAKNPYIGDMTANQRVADILAIADQFGSYTNELHTVTEPYGWDINLKRAFAGAQLEHSRELMEREACLLLATVGNLGYVTWNYTVDGTAESLTITAEDATERAGQDIKQCAETRAGLTRLIESLGPAPVTDQPLIVQ